MQNNEDSFPKEHSYLKRLPKEAYQAFAVVHWSMTIDNRKKGWLTDLFHARFREILTHTAFRYKVIIPSYVLMPDHLHLIAMGYSESSDQKIAMRFVRKQLNWILKPAGFELQKQGFDHVIREESRKPDVFPKVVGYVRENPLRGELVSDADDLPSYLHAGCLVPGYPELNVWDETFWDSFWKLYYLHCESEEKGSN